MINYERCLEAKVSQFKYLKDCQTKKGKFGIVKAFKYFEKQEPRRC